jgi:hypothetical protein
MLIMFLAGPCYTVELLEVALGSGKREKFVYIPPRRWVTTLRIDS